MINQLINNFIVSKGYRTVKSNYYAQIQDWLDWYRCDVDDRHKTTFYNGFNVVEKDIKRLGMAKVVSETWANSLMNEKVEIKLPNDSSNEQLQNILNDNNYRERINQLIELTFALGTGATTEYIDNNEIKIDYITADMIYPLSWDTRGVIECLFGSKIRYKNQDCIYIQMHILDESGNYVIENHIITDDDEEYSFNELELPNGLQPVVETHNNVPLFQIYKPNIVNNYDLKNPMGISIYANSTDTLMELDLSFDALSTEIETGRRMVFMASDMFFADSNGNIRNVIGERESIIRYIGETDGDDGKKLVRDFSPQFRISDLNDAIKMQLNILSEKCGMGTNQFEFDNSSVKTATEIISENSDFYVAIKKHELVIEKAIIGMVNAIASLTQGMNVDGVSVNFDDSIIEDTSEIRRQSLLELNAGLIDNVQYFIQTRNYSEEEAIAFVDSMKERAPEELTDEEKMLQQAKNNGDE